MQELTSFTPEQAATILNHLFPRWINQRPGLEFGNYGDRRSYNAELRGITKQRKEALEALQQAQCFPVDAGKLKEAFRAFSGRLSVVSGTLEGRNGGLAFDYTAGQYFPTEYRAAAGAVLREYVRLHKLERTPTPLPAGEEWTIAKIKAANEETGGTWFSRSNMRFFRTRIDREVYQGPGGVFFVYSNQFVDSNGRAHDREYKALGFDSATGDTRGGEHIAYERGLISQAELGHYPRTRRDAHNLAERLAKGETVAQGGAA